MKGVIPNEAPTPSNVELVNMTIGFELCKFVNLKLIAEHMDLDDTILGIKFENTIRGQCKKNKPSKKTKSKYRKKKNNDFKNQCTIIVNVGTKALNVKLFNNGQLVFTGCKDIKQIEIATNAVVTRIHNLQGHVKYIIPSTFKQSGSKNIFKKEIAQYRELIHVLIFAIGITNIDAEPFNPILTQQEACEIFVDHFEDSQSTDGRYILGLLQIIEILKSYYDINVIQQWKSDENITPFARNIIDAWQPDAERQEICLELPSYLNNDQLIEPDYNKVTISNINNRMSCNYPLNREVVAKLLRNDERIFSVDLDEDRYPGVITLLKTKSGRNVTIIYFNSGKVTITSTKTQEQVHEAYKFITDFCREHFNELLMKRDYLAKIKSARDEMPDHFDLGEHDGIQYVLLKKQHILQNPRNVLLLKKFKILDEYK